MRLLIDTYNVLHTVGVLPPDLAGIETEGLIELIEHSRYRRQRVDIVCDGVPAEGQFRRDVKKVTLRYSGADRTADELIAKMIEMSAAPRRLLVVSSDHEVQRHARRNRCRTLTSAEFLQHLVDDVQKIPNRPEAQKPGGPLTKGQIHQWLGHFDIDDDVLNIPASDPPPPAPAPQKEKPEAVDDQRSDDALPADLLADAQRLADEHADAMEREPPPPPVDEETDDEPSRDNPKSRPRTFKRIDKKNLDEQSLDDDTMRLLFPDVQPDRPQ